MPRQISPIFFYGPPLVLHQRARGDYSLLHVGYINEFYLGYTMAKKSLAAAVLFLSAGSLAHANTFNGKTMAMSDAGVATSSYLEGMNLNPAALANFEANDDFDLHLNLGALLSDEDDLLDNAEDLADLVDAIDRSIPAVADVHKAIKYLRALEGATAVLEAGGGLYANIPTQVLSVGVFARTNLSLGAAAEVDRQDIARLEDIANLTNPTPLDADDFKSSVTAFGASVTEVGVTFARRQGNISYGISPKYQRIDVIDYRARVSTFDEDDLDANEYTRDDSGFNLDLGIQAELGNWQLGAVLFNAIEQDYKSVNGRKITIEPRLTVGAGYRNSWFTAALDVDANSTANLITPEESRFARAGIEMNAFGRAQLRFGYKKDLESVLEDTVSVGIGFSPFGVVNVDLSAVKGDHDTVGGALQIGFSF